MKLWLVFFVILMIGLVSSAQEDNPYSYNLLPVPQLTNVTNETVNHSNSTLWWVTSDLGAINSVSSISASDITDDGTYRTLTNATFTMPIWSNSNITTTANLSVGGATTDHSHKLYTSNDAYLQVRNWEFLGAFDTPALYGNSDVLSFMAINNLLYIKGKDATSSGGIILTNYTGTATAKIQYYQAIDLVSFENANRWAFQNDTLIDSDSEGLWFGETQAYELAFDGDSMQFGNGTFNSAFGNINDPASVLEVRQGNYPDGITTSHATGGNYLITRGKTGHDSLAFQKSDATGGTEGYYEFFSQDGDATSNVELALYLVGTPTSTVNLEYLLIMANAVDDKFYIQSSHSGAGDINDLIIQTAGNTNQLYLDYNTGAKSGRVGVMTGSPAYTLDVNGTGRFQRPVNISGGENALRIYDNRSRAGNNNVTTWYDNTGACLMHLAYSSLGDNDLEIRFCDDENTKIGFPYADYFAFVNDVSQIWLGTTGDPTVYINYDVGDYVYFGSPSRALTQVTLSTESLQLINADGGHQLDIRPPSSDGDYVEFYMPVDTAGIQILGYSALSFRDENITIASLTDGDLMIDADETITINTTQTNFTGEVVFEDDITHGTNTGLTGNYSVGTCYMAYSGGIMYSSNCSTF